MIKPVKTHTIYEVWNEWAAESVYFTHKPSKKDVREVVDKEGWFTTSADCYDEEEFIRKYVHVDKLPHVYEHVCECGMCKGGIQ